MFEFIATANAAETLDKLSDNPMEWGYMLWLMILIMTLPGGVANCINRIKADGLTWSWRGILELIKDMMWSGSIGPLAFMYVIKQTDDIAYALIACAISAHIAPRLIFSGNAIVDIGTSKYLKKIDPEAKKHQFSDEELNELIKKAIEDSKDKP